MDEIKRDQYLRRLLSKRGNGLVKVVTGVRRCGKSYLLDPLFKEELLREGVPADHIVKVELDRISNKRFHDNPEAFDRYIREQIRDGERHYVILDEIQLVEGFSWVLNGLLYERNLDIYVTGSNSKFLSNDISTEFRGRGDSVQLRPLSFSEFSQARGGDRTECLNEYLTYGGMPLVLSQADDASKASYLPELFSETYFKDITARYGLERIDILDSLVNILASSVGSLTNPAKLYHTFCSKGVKGLSVNTLCSYLGYLEDAFLVKKAMRYDVKGKKYIGTPYKFYFSDLGLRNARLNFRQQEETHLMENAIYNELLCRGYNVDVGRVELRERNTRLQTEIDFVCNAGDKRYYIQSALYLPDGEKTRQESRPLNHTGDNFKKMIVVKDHVKPWHTEDGILVVGLFDFLSSPDSLDW
ncbi:MAG: ATP-binding protein [Oligosphaeraceae bacterium]